MFSDVKYRVADLELSIRLLEEENSSLRMAGGTDQVRRNRELIEMKSLVEKLTKQNIDLRNELQKSRDEKEALFSLFQSLAKGLQNQVSGFKKDIFSWFYVNQKAKESLTIEEQQIHEKMIYHLLEKALSGRP